MADFAAASTVAGTSNAVGAIRLGAAVTSTVAETLNIVGSVNSKHAVTGPVAATSTVSGNPIAKHAVTAVAAAVAATVGSIGGTFQRQVEYARGRTTVSVAGGIGPVIITIDVASGTSSATVDLIRPGYLQPDPVFASTTVWVATVHALQPDVVAAATDVTVDFTPAGVRDLTPDLVSGTSSARVMYVPDLSDNAPIWAALSLTGRLDTVDNADWSTPDVDPDGWT